MRRAPIRLPAMRVLCPLVAAIAFNSPASAQETAAETAEVRAVVDAFKTALRSGDTGAAMAQLHADVRIFEGGHAETRDEYEGGHLGADMRFLQAVESTTTWDRLTVDDETALYLSQYTVKGEYRGREIDSHGTETMVLARTDSGWKIIHIHWSSR